MVIDHIGDKLRVGQRLIHAAHDAEANVLVAVLHEGGNDGVEGTLAAGECIGRLAIDGKEASAILKHEPHAQHRNIRSKRIIVALDKGKDITFAIDDGEIRGIASRQGGRSHMAIRLVCIDPGGSLGGVPFDISSLTGIDPNRGSPS